MLLINFISVCVSQFERERKSESESKNEREKRGEDGGKEVDIES